MTVGELAKFFNEEKLINAENSADLTVVEMQNWKRKMYFDETGLEWVNPSPNMPNLETAIVYPGLCFIEGTNLSEGRGTYEPFLKIGAPFVNSEELIAKLDELNSKGIAYEAVTFTPKAIPKMSSHPKLKGKECNGILLSVDNRDDFTPVTFGVKLLYAIHELYPDEMEFRGNWLDKLFGETYLRQMLKDGEDISKILKKWETETEKFKQERKNYLLY
jgi:beta-N-acetylhexosaminidase